jgi:hypothetical protein
VPDIAFVSIQHGEAAKQIAAHAFQRRVIDLSNLQTDLLDTAAILHNVDLLISVDTAALHLAGALGRPAWRLIPRAQDFRWLLERDDSPWYPTLRLFRQARHGAWGAGGRTRRGGACKMAAHGSAGLHEQYLVRISHVLTVRGKTRHMPLRCSLDDNEGGVP